MHLKLIVVVIVTIFMTGCASKNKGFPSGKESVTSLLPGGALLIGFNRSDDYEIDVAELTEGRDKAFIKADLNGNGVINLSEFRFWKPQALGSRSASPNLVYFDRNFNDKISQAEFDTALQKLFKDADKNNDSKVSYQELISIVSAPEKRSNKGRSQERGSGSRKGRGGGPPNS